MRDILHMSAHPMVIVTVATRDERDGCLVGYHSPVSISPRRYMVCLSPENQTHDLALTADTLIVHHVGVAQAGLARLFGEETGYEVDKFDRCNWERGPDGVPRLADIDTWWAGRIVDRITLGDHTAFVLEPFVVEVGDILDPLDSAAAASFSPGNPRR